MAATKNKLEFDDYIDDLGRWYLILLFVSGAIWAFIAINNFDTPNIFKLALIYSILLIFGFLGVSYDRRTQQLGLDSRIWERKNLNRQLAVAIIFFAIWYVVFMQSGFSVATAQSVGNAAFSINPTLNFILVGFLGPLAENIFFFGVLNITLIYLLRQLITDRSKSIVFALLLAASYPLFKNVPNSLYFLLAASALVVITSLSKSRFLQKHAPIFVSALFIGAVVFPRFHSYAYQLNERNYFAATWFGLFMCIIAAYIGMMPVDILHWGNNMIVALGG